MPRTNRNAMKPAGFTLIEIVITMGILILMLVFFQSSVSTLQLTRMQQHKDMVLRVIDQKLESLRAGGYNALPASGTFTDPLLNTLQSPVASTTVIAYNAQIKEVTVGVTWIDVASTTQYLGETTLITESGGL